MLAVRDGLLLPVGVLVRVRVTLELDAPVRVTVRLTDDDFVIDLLTEGVGVSVRVMVRLTDDDFVIDLLTEGVGVSDRVSVGVVDGDREIVRLTLGLAMEVRDTEGVRVLVRVTVGVRENGILMGAEGSLGNPVGSSV